MCRSFWALGVELGGFSHTFGSETSESPREPTLTTSNLGLINSRWWSKRWSDRGNRTWSARRGVDSGGGDWLLVFPIQEKSAPTLAAKSK